MNKPAINNNSTTKDRLFFEMSMSINFNQRSSKYILEKVVIQQLTLKNNYHLK